MAWALNSVANDRANQALYQNRINAFIAQGMSYPQAVAAYHQAIAWEAEQAGPQKMSVFWLIVGAGWTLGMFILLAHTITYPPPHAEVASDIISSLVCMALGAIVVGFQLRRYMVRDAWKIRRQAAARSRAGYTYDVAAWGASLAARDARKAAADARARQSGSS
jgi:hypothetical protein